MTFQALFGLRRDKKAAEDTDGLTIREKNYKPEFGRIYGCEVLSGITITISARNMCSGRYYSGELIQPGGRWVLFDPKKPADKILDRDLSPAIAVLCKRILELDWAWFKSNPAEFTDESGQRWRRTE